MKIIQPQIGIITQARMTSTRLPGKIFKEINGKSLLQYHIERLKQTGFDIAIATTTNVTDDSICEFAGKQKIKFYRGNENNVLSRYYETAVKFEYDIIVRVTSDCPLIDPYLIQNSVEKYLQLNNLNLYLSNGIDRTYARGFDFEVFSFQLLKNAYQNATDVSDLEHVTPYIWKNRSGKVEFYSVKQNINNSRLRVTVDTLEDFELIKILIGEFNADKLSNCEIEKILTQHPELIELNAHIEQKKPEPILKTDIFIRADGGTTTGMGHVIRCLALAEMLKNDFSITFAIQQPPESIVKCIQSTVSKIISLPFTNDYNTDALNFTKYLKPDDIVIIDGYNFKTDYEKKIKEKKCKLICIDDLHAWHHIADAIINHAEGIDESEYSTEPYTQFFLGLRYVLLRKEFLNRESSPRKENAVKKIFISMGAADVNNATKKFTEALLQIHGIEEIHLMLGSINPNLKSIDDLIKKNNQIKIKTYFDISAEELYRLLQHCDVAVCPASTISLECCAVGIGLVSGFTSENQTGILNGLKKHKTAIDLGNMDQLSVREIIKNFEKLAKQPEIFNEQIKNQKEMIDGKSPERLIDIFKSLSKEKLHFRFADESDVDQYFKWANDSLVRLNSYNQNSIVYEDHVKWFQSKLSSMDCYLYFFLNEENKPVGQVRIDKYRGEVIIGISIDKTFRGKSYGVEMLEAASRNYLTKNPSSIIAAYIKMENTVSYNIFLKAGFNSKKNIDEQGYKSFKLSKKLSS